MTKDFNYNSKHASFFTLQEAGGVTGAFKKNSIVNWLSKHNSNRTINLSNKNLFFFQ
jgi:hypothetical protein